VTAQQVLALDLRARVGWLVNIVEKTLGLYSDYFRRESLADEFIALSWRFAEFGDVSTGEANALLERVYALIDEDARGIQDDYYDAIRLAYLPLGERINLDASGRDAVVCVERAALVLADRLHWVARTTVGPGRTDQYSRRAVAALYGYAHATLPVAAEAPPRRGMFDHIPLRLPRPEGGEPPCPEDVIPLHERGELLLLPGVVWETT
jgi:hypothetical protein